MFDSNQNNDASTPEGTTIEVPFGNNQEQAEDSAAAPLTAEEEAEKRRHCYKKSFFAILLVGFIAYIIADSLTAGNVSDAVDSFLQWIEDNPVPGIFVFMLVYLVATIFFIPGSILTLGAGFVFANAFGLGLGVLLGTVSVFFGASAGAIAAFLIGRYLMRDWVSTLSQKYAIFQALDVAFEEKGLRIMTLLRLSPVIPFNAINYVAGVTALSFSQYVISLIAILPGTILYVFLGASAGSLTDSASSGDNTTVAIIVIVVGIIFGIGAVGVTSYYAKQELNRIAEKRNDEQEDMEDADAEEGNATEKEEGDKTMPLIENVELPERTPIMTKVNPSYM
jgi:uncharacterized membrane protein YdjX (TVP38/TMEM64 family)